MAIQGAVADESTEPDDGWVRGWCLDCAVRGKVGGSHSSCVKPPADYFGRHFMYIDGQWMTPADELEETH